MAQRIRLRGGPGARPGVALGVLVAMVGLAGCSAAAKVNASSPTTTSAFTHAQVLGWVTPTLANGISLVGSAPPGASSAQLASASQPLGTAASVSLHELAQISWTGALSRDETALVNALKRIESEAARVSTATSLKVLETDITSAQTALHALHHAVDH